VICGTSFCHLGVSVSGLTATEQQILGYVHPPSRCLYRNETNSRLLRWLRMISLVRGSLRTPKHIFWQRSEIIPDAKHQKRRSNLPRGTDNCGTSNRIYSNRFLTLARYLRMGTTLPAGGTAICTVIASRLHRSCFRLFLCEIRS
jgi:hypothetical protein